MDHYGWHRWIYQSVSMCCSSPLNPQVLFYDGCDIKFDHMSLEILCKHNIQYFILNTGSYVHDQPNDNSPNMKLNNLYGNPINNWMRHNGTLKFTPAHMNYVLVAIWESFGLSSTKITHNYFKRTHIPPLYPPDIYTDRQDFLGGTQQSNREKSDEIVQI